MNEFGKRKCFISLQFYYYECDGVGQFMLFYSEALKMINIFQNKNTRISIRFS